VSGSGSVFIRLVLLVTWFALHVATASAQSLTDGGGRTRIDVELAAEDMRRYPSISTALGQLGNRGADVALDKVFGVPEGTGARAVAHRILRTYLVSLPIAALSATAAHELGHVSRGHEGGLSISGFKIDQWPWPVPVMSARLYVDTSGPAPPQLNELSAVAGGAEGARVQALDLLETIYSGRSTNYFNWLLLADAKLEMPFYTWTDKSPPEVLGDPGQFAQEFGFTRAVMRYRPGAPVVNFADPERAAAWQTLRHGMWLNLVDYALVAAVVQTVEYVRTGNRDTSVPALRRGSLGFVPALHFLMTSDGFERGVDVHVISDRTLTRVDVRWTDAPTGERLWGGGVGLHARGPRWQPQFRADIFERTASLSERPQEHNVGVRIEAGARLPLHARRPFDVGFRIGYKTRGFLVDAPERRTLLGGVSFGMSF